MKNTEYQKLLKSDIFDPIMKLTELKGHDYATDGDTLRNFKVVAETLSRLLNRSVLPSEVCMFFIVVKQARLANLRCKNPQCESVLDTIRDLINYTGLYYACLIEEKHKPKEFKAGKKKITKRGVPKGRRHDPKRFKVGDRVEIWSRAYDYEGGWDNLWAVEMCDTLGCKGVISKNAGAEGYEVELKNSSNAAFYPSFSLRKVNEK